jgi:hypothetical protein
MTFFLSFFYFFLLVSFENFPLPTFGSTSETCPSLFGIHLKLGLRFQTASKNFVFEDLMFAMLKMVELLTINSGVGDVQKAGQTFHYRTGKKA